MIVLDANHIRGLEMAARERNVPLNVLFELTYRCNLSCRHCYVCDDGGGEMSTAEVLGVLSQLAEAGTLFVTFSGGEIMMRPDIYEIVAEARKRDFAVRLFTNGTLIDAHEADQLAALDPVDVGISVYAARPERHDFITRNPGSFAAAVEAIRLLVARDVHVVAKCPVMGLSREEIRAVQQLAADLGARIMFDPQITPRLDGDPSPQHYCVDEATLAWMLVVEEVGEVPDLDHALPCSAGRDFASISPGGNLAPCVQVPVTLGNLRDDSFGAIWNGEAAVAYRKLRTADVEGCAECPDARYCSPCLGLNMLETGDVRRPAASSCRLARARRGEVLS